MREASEVSKMDELFEVVDNQGDNAVIKVIGIGGGGSNTICQMVNSGISGVEFICANTDAQHLQGCRADTLVQLGANVTRGLGAGADPETGKQAALEDRERLREVIDGTDMLFITAGMGGGTGTGAAPVVAEIAREMDILTVAVVTKPFPFERNKRMQVAKEGLDYLGQFVDSLIVIPNERLLTTLGRSTSLKSAFKAANGVLQNAVQGIADLITRPGQINVDFADVRKVMSVRGMAMMGIGVGTGENRAQQAAETALASPLLEELNLSGARGLLVNVTAAEENLEIAEFQMVNELIAEMGSEDAEVIVGTAFDPDVGDELRVTVVATGLGEQPKQNKVSLVRQLQRDNNGEPRYEELEKPTVIRRQRTENAVEQLDDSDMDYLDVPAFLRNQAD
jgi:cell division protein FtsZ